MFCGRSGNITKEHAWPQWLGDGAEVVPHQTTRTIGFGRTAHDAMSEAPNRATTKPVSVLTARIREVCADCNNGWMSCLESAVRPILTRLWAPNYPFGRTTFSAEDAATLATWATKTAWVRERVGDPVLTATAEMRRGLVDQQRPPEWTSIWVARHEGASNFGVYVARIAVAHQDDPWNAEPRAHALLCTLTFRGLSILVRTDDRWGIPQMDMPNDVWRRFCPVSQPVEWPPSRPASDGDVLAAASSLGGWLKVPEVPIFNRAVLGWRETRRN